MAKYKPTPIVDHRKPAPVAGSALTGKPTPAPKPVVVANGRPVWLFSSIDFDGPWCPKKLTGNDLVWLVDRLRDKEMMTWHEIEADGSHHIATERVISDARKRLREIRRDDLDRLWSMRLGGKERLWGVKNGDAFSILWWDPEHEICPSAKKHT